MAIVQRVAAKAVIVHDDRALILRESGSYQEGTNVGKYDLPGGRIEPGEAVLEALVREIYEETGQTVTVGRPVHVDEWTPVIHGQETQIVGIFFYCEAGSYEVDLSSDHDLAVWVSLQDIEKYPILGQAKRAIRFALA